MKLAQLLAFALQPQTCVASLFWSNHSASLRRLGDLRLTSVSYPPHCSPSTSCSFTNHTKSNHYLLLLLFIVVNRSRPLAWVVVVVCFVLYNIHSVNCFFVLFVYFFFTYYFNQFHWYDVQKAHLTVMAMRAWCGDIKRGPKGWPSYHFAHEHFLFFSHLGECMPEMYASRM